MLGRFRIEAVHEVRKDPGGHEHHWTVLEGVLVEGTIRIGDPLAIPRVAGGHWLAQIAGFERFREAFGASVDAKSEAGRTLGVAVWGVAPPPAGTGKGEAEVVLEIEAQRLALALSGSEPAAINHCRDCRRIVRYLDRASVAARLDAILANDSLDLDDAAMSKLDAIEALHDERGWEPVRDQMMAVLEDPSRRDADWETIAAAFWNAGLEQRSVNANRLIALVYARLPNDRDSSENNLAWSIASKLKGEGYLSRYDPLADPEVCRELATLTRRA